MNNRLEDLLHEFFQHVYYTRGGKWAFPDQYGCDIVFPQELQVIIDDLEQALQDDPISIDDAYDNVMEDFDEYN